MYICLALSGGECFIPQEQVNPLGLIGRPGVQEVPLDTINTGNIVLNSQLSSKVSNYQIKNSSTSYHQNRIRREHNYKFSPETYNIDNGKHLEIIKMVICIYIHQSMGNNLLIKLFALQNCLIGNAKCLKFYCQINSLLKNQEATIFIKAR